MKSLINRLRDTASKGMSVLGDLQMEAADAIERMTSAGVALPEPEGKVTYPSYPYEPGWTSSEDAYTTSQMLEYGARCRADERERVMTEALRLIGVGGSAHTIYTRLVLFKNGEHL